MKKRKLFKFAQLETFNNVIQPSPEEFVHEDFFLKGKWKSEYFKNNNPIILELGCGKGEYTISLAEVYPDKNFIGVDIKGDRLWRGGKTALDKNLVNVAFLRIHIEKINNFFSQDEVSEIWITFPDPQPNKPNIKKRLTSLQFLERYKKILSEKSIIHLKTDNAPLFDFTLEVIENYKHHLIYQTHDLYNEKNIKEELHIKTYYEQMFLKEGLPICYLEFSLSPSSV